MRSAFRTATAAALATLAVLATPTPATAASETTTVTAPLREALAALPVQAEDRTGYDRDAFRHWINADRDGCTTRPEASP